jgi:MtaA/CmuA family methyltransferase
MKLRDYFDSLGRTGAVPILGYPGLVSENVTTQQSLLDPKVHARVVEKNVRLFEPDAALPLLDITVEAESFGLMAEFRNQDPPQLRSTLPLETAETLQVQDIFKAHRITLLVEAARIISSQVSKVPVGFFVTGPFTIAGQIVGVQQLLTGIFKAPEAISRLLEKCTRITVDYAKRLAETEINFLVMADPTSSLISPDQFENFAKAPITRVVKSVSKEIVLHICGRSGHLLRAMFETGVAGLSLDDNVRLVDAARTVPREILIFGNYSPTSILLEKPEKISAAVTEMLASAEEAPNIVASTGCDIPANAPEENIRAFIRAAKSYAPGQPRG